MKKNDSSTREPGRAHADPDPAAWSTERMEALRHLGYASPPEIVESLAIPVERGHHVAALAAEGSGKEILFGLAVLHRCETEMADLQALILSPTPEAALRAARAIHMLGRPSGVRAVIWPPWAPPESQSPSSAAQAVAGPPEDVLSGVREGKLPLARVRLLIIDGFQAIQAAGAWPSVEALIEALPPEAQRIVCGDRLDASLMDLLRRRFPRARHWPPELFETAGEDVARGGAPGSRHGSGSRTVWCTIATGETEKLEALADGLAFLTDCAGSERAVVRCADAPAAARTTGALAAMGFRLADAGSAGVKVVWGEEPEHDSPVVALFGIPSGLDVFRRWLEPAAEGLIVADTTHFPQLELLGRRAGWEVHLLPSGLLLADRNELERFRRHLASEIQTSDSAAQLLLLEPLLERFGSARVAATLAAMVRRPEAPESAGPEPAARSRGGAAPTGGRPPSGPQRKIRPTWTRIFIGVGKKDGAGPGDLVGAITGETEAAGGQIGKVEIHNGYSLVDVDSQIAEDVIRGLKGTRIRGRDVVARRERER